ncbi:MAG TPA: hypothetical protein VGT98_11935 [Candidatus Elarobacter sp.]|nr:hypothetical protein [Candidatus Elarobacter sp.]HEV2737162.1 hypothetical protein [Candidatus Elarobacter sp.]
MSTEALIWTFLALCAGGGITAAVMTYQRARRFGSDVADWVQIANMNTLLRLDLDHLTGDDDNFGLCEARGALKASTASRPAAERKLFEHYNALVGIAIKFGEKVHDEHGIVDLQAVANRRAHVQNALAVGDQLEAALGGISELAKCVNRDRNERVRQSYQTPVLATVTQMIS